MSDVKSSVNRHVTRFFGHLLGEALDGFMVAFGLRQFFPSLAGKKKEQDEKPEAKTGENQPAPPSIKTEEDLRGFGDEQLMLEELLIVRHSNTNRDWQDRCDEFLAWYNRQKPSHRKNLRRGYIAEKDERKRLVTLERLVNLTDEQRDAVVSAPGFTEKTPQEQARERLEEGLRMLQRHAPPIVEAGSQALQQASNNLANNKTVKIARRFIR